MVVITSCDLDPAAAVAAAAGLFPRQQLRDSQPGWCVSAAAVPGLDRSKKRGERVKHWGRLIFLFQSRAIMWLTFIFLSTEACLDECRVSCSAPIHRAVCDLADLGRAGP